MTKTLKILGVLLLGSSVYVYNTLPIEKKQEVTLGGPTVQNLISIQPFIDNTYDNGSATNAWRNLYTYGIKFSTTTTGCLNGNTTASGIVTAYFTGTACGSGAGSGDPFSHFNGVNSATTTSLAVGTTTGSNYQFISASSTAPQISLSAGGGILQWTFRNAGGNFYVATTTIVGTATTTIPALTVVGSTGNLGIGTTTPWGKLSVDPVALGSGVPEFVVGSTSRTHFLVDGNGNVGINRPTAAYPVDANAISRTNIREILFRGVVSDAQNDAIFIYNATSGDGLFAPAFAGFQDTSSARNALSFRGMITAANDVGSTPMITFNTLLTTSGTDPVNNTNVTPIANRPLFDFQSSDASRMIIMPRGSIGLSTTTPLYPLTIASSTAPQLSLSVGAGVSQWVMRNAGGNFYIAPTTVVGTATSTSALSIIGSSGNVGIGTTSPFKLLSSVGDIWSNARITGSFLKATSTAVNITDVTVTNSNASTTVFALANYQNRVFPANTLVAGDQICFDLRGIYSTPVTGGAVTVRVVMGTGAASTTVAQMTTSALIGSATNLPFDGNGCLTVRTIGASASMRVDGMVMYQIAGSASQPDYIKGAGTVDTTVAQTVDITVTWDTVDASKSVTFTTASTIIK